MTFHDMQAPRFPMLAGVSSFQILSPRWSSEKGQMRTLPVNAGDSPRLTRTSVDKRGRLFAGVLCGHLRSMTRHDTNVLNP
jgi:hypothetical protein